MLATVLMEEMKTSATGTFKMLFKEYHSIALLEEGKIEKWWGTLAWNFKATWKSVLEELVKSKHAGKILMRAAEGNEISQDEKDFVRSQVKDIMKGVVFGSVTAVPGSMIIIPLLLWVSKRMGIELRPSSLVKNLKERPDNNENI